MLRPTGCYCHTMVLTRGRENIAVDMDLGGCILLGMCEHRRACRVELFHWHNPI